MATRPTGNPPIWAQTVNYPAGPDVWAGSPTKVQAPTNTGVGFTPETGIVADYANFEFNAYSTWVEWLSFGSNLAALDAHVVETDSSGRVRIAYSTLGATVAAVGPVITIDSSNHATPQAMAVIAANHSAITATNNGASDTVNAVNAGSGACINADAQAGGVCIDADSTTAAAVDAESTGNHGVHGKTDAATFAGVYGQAAVAVGSFGVWGDTRSVGGRGVAGTNSFAGGSPTDETQVGVFGFGNSTAGVWGRSIDAYGVVAEGDTTTPVRAAFRMVPQDADPSSGLDGDMYPNLGTGLLRFRRGSQWRSMHDSQYGFVANSVDGLSGSQNTAPMTVKHSISLGTPNDPKFAGDVELEFTASVRNINDVLTTFEIEFQDQTAGGTVIKTSEIYLASTNTNVTNPPVGARPNAYEKTITFRARYSLPASGPRTFDVAFAAYGTGAPAGVEWVDGMLSVKGVF